MTTPTDNDAQAKALVAALAPLIAEAIIPQLAAKVEEQVKGIKTKNDELLDKLANLKKDDEIAAQPGTGTACFYPLRQIFRRHAAHRKNGHLRRQNGL